VTAAFRDDPLLIGALGGSGTRVFSKIARHAGIHMGAHVDGHEDAKPFSSFYRENARRYLEQGRRFTPEQRAEVDAALDERVRRHLERLRDPDRRWGVKNPRSMLLLPYWHERFPGLRFLHVVRHGLDMAYSDNDNQLRKYGDVVLGDGVETSSPERALLYWQEANRVAADYGERELGDRYARVRLEELCEDPRATVRRLFDFFAPADDSGYEAAVAEVGRPGTIGRWREHPAERNARLAELGREGLARFGYSAGLYIEA